MRQSRVTWKATGSWAACEYEYAGAKATYPLEPIRLVSRNAFSPLQPVQKYPPLRPGQTWRASNIDPVGDALEGAMRQVVSKMLAAEFGGKAPVSLPAARRPTELLARVQADTEEVSTRTSRHVCRVIVFEGGDVTARTWVDVADGRAVRQEAKAAGETFVLERD